MQGLPVLILSLFLLAAFFRVEFFFYILYVLFGVYVLSRLWGERSLRAIALEREYNPRALLGEHMAVSLRVRNQSLLPVPWLRLHDSLPVQVKAPNFYRCVLSLMPKEQTTLRYELDCRKRGYYQLGPLSLNTGDLFGLRSHERRVVSDDYLMVYPRILPLTELGLPAQTPFGAIHSKQRLYEDPTRLGGVRDYQSGDRQRDIHWKSSASVGRLQVKRFEPAISIEAHIFLDLQRGEYSRQRVDTASELAIVTAASIANHLVDKRQTVGLSCNGLDPASPDQRMIALPPRKGREQLVQLLDVLARVQLGERCPFTDLMREARLHMRWGGTGIIIAPDGDDALFEHMLLMKRAGYHVVLVVVDPRTPFANLQQRAQQVGIRAHQVWQESDLDAWR